MFDFPATPVDGQKFTPSGGPNYIYSTPTWKFDPTPTVPDAPKDGQTYGRMNGLWADVAEEAPMDGITYGRKSGAWASIVGGAVISDAAPTGTLQAGQMWWESDTGSLYIYYNDGDSSQWVMVVPGAPTMPKVVGDLDMQGYSVLNAHHYSGLLGIDAVLANASGSTGGIHLRPRGASVSTGEMVVDTNGNITGPATVTANTFTSTGQVFQSSTANAILAPTGAGNCYMRPNGAQSTAGQVVVSSNGELAIAAGGVKAAPGYFCRAGQSGGAWGNIFNFWWTSSALQVWIDGSNMGNMSIASDYRVKKDVQDLDRTWDIVKALRPVKYTQADYAPLFEADEVPRWGFLAHELQETTIMDAATGYKDAPDLVQSPNPWTIIAALTKTVQELQARVEALEAA
jgi:hypothetical protein